tara:strand:- start:22485 stop:23513 length:1029 start_codon:yes stop_codon:yes gene_type:complete
VDIANASKISMKDNKKIAITMGDPSGIGPETIVKALSSEDLGNFIPIIIGSKKAIAKQIKINKSKILLKEINNINQVNSHNPYEVFIINPGLETYDFPIGKLDIRSGKESHKWVEFAAKLCIEKKVSAMVTAPINKEAWSMAGIKDTGHQEVFKRMAKSPYVATMLVTGNLRCMHLSTHKPLIDACKYVTKKNIIRAIKLTNESFRSWGYDKPKIAVAALNPHASDNGLIGDTESKEIAPAVKFMQEKGITVSGPHPADSIFNQAINGNYDVVIVMYHDQGHIAIKVHGLEESISINLGIPFIRTSVDHGTAFDIASKNIADSTSMKEAIKQACFLINNKKI